MSQPHFESPTWYEAIPLTERLASLRDHQKKSIQVAEEGRHNPRYQQWRSQIPFHDDDTFARRLAADGMNEDEFLRLLNEPIEAVYRRTASPPAWLEGIAQAFSPSELADTESPPEIFNGVPIVGFFNAIDPLIRQAQERLRQHIQVLVRSHSHAPFDPDTAENLLLANLPSPLLVALNRTMVLELHVARLEGLLSGETSDARFESFTKRLRRPDVALTILQEYPVLTRQITILLDQWVEFSAAFLRHLCQDWPAIRDAFSPEEDPGVLTAVQGNVGDRHRGGRTVLIAEFESGFQVVYKPKSLAIDRHFQELLAWLNERGHHPPFKVPEIIDRGLYGWAEFITAVPCTSPAQLQRFYERQGGYLALLYMLQATDFHGENLIAAGEHPMLVDLESLFHPGRVKVDADQSTQLAADAINRSVLRIGLLPQRIWGNRQNDGVDISGIGGAPGQLTPYGVPTWEDVGTDEMRFVRKRMPLSGKHNRPTLNGDEVEVLDYAQSIVTGFVNIYRLLWQHRQELLAPDGPLAQFTHDEARVIFRPTRAYLELLFDGFHPDFLRNALDRERLFDRLWADITQNSHLSQIIPAERAALWRNDVPMFTTRIGSRDLWGDADEQIPGFLEESSLDLVQRRVEQLSQDDLARQLWFVQASLATLAMGKEEAQQAVYRPVTVTKRADAAHFLAAAKAIGDRLERLALRGKEDAAWLGVALVNKNQWALQPLGIDLYNGLPGIALFLAYLGQMSAEPRYQRLAEATLKTIQYYLEPMKQSMKPVGGFDGWGGIIYTLTHLGVLWQRPDLLDEAEAVASWLPPLIEQDEVYDVLVGAAGCLASLLALYHCRPSEHTLAVARLCGEHLLAQAKPMSPGIGWPARYASERALSGFSHGIAGIAWALLALAAITGEDRFRQAALAGIAHERTLFSPELKNWLDMRDDAVQATLADGRPRCMTTWCHGAPGIGLGRLQSLAYWDDDKDAIYAEIETALNTTLAKGFGLGHSLCHGDLGNLETVLRASEILGDGRWSQEVTRLGSIVAASIEQYGWVCGVPMGVETPGLMTGLAGIGYGLLRLADPARVPSVLVLEPPKTNRH